MSEKVKCALGVKKNPNYAHVSFISVTSHCMHHNQPNARKRNTFSNIVQNQSGAPQVINRL